MSYTTPTTPAGLRSERAAATRRSMTVAEYRARRLAGWYFCPACDKWLVEDDFHADLSRASGLRKICKGCSSDRRRATPEQRRQRAALKVRAKKAKRDDALREVYLLKKEAKRAEAMRRQAVAQEQYDANYATSRPPVLPYALRHSRPGGLTEALRIDTRGVRDERSH